MIPCLDKGNNEKALDFIMIKGFYILKYNINNVTLSGFEPLCKFIFYNHNIPMGLTKMIMKDSIM